MQVPVMPSRPHEDAVVESFRDDPGFALYMLSHSLEEGDEAVFLNMGIPMIVTADSGDRDRAVPGPWI